MLLAAVLMVPVSGSLHAQTVDKAELQTQLNALNDKLISLLTQLIAQLNKKIEDQQTAMVSLVESLAVTKANDPVVVAATSTVINLGSSQPVTPGIDPVSGMPTYEYLKVNIENGNALKKLCRGNARQDNPGVERLCAEEHL